MQSEVLDFIVESEQPQIGRDRRTRSTDQASELALGINLSRVQKILVVQGLFEGVRMPLELEAARFSAFSTDLDVGSVFPISLINMELIPDHQGLIPASLRASNTWSLCVVGRNLATVLTSDAVNASIDYSRCFNRPTPFPVVVVDPSNRSFLVRLVGNDVMTLLR